MRKALIMLMVLAVVCVVAAGTSANTKIPQSILIDNESVISESSLSKPISHTDNGAILDIPANDDCANAAVIGDNETIHFNTEDATADGLSDYIESPNVWFTYIASITAPIQIVVSDTGSDYYTTRIRCAAYDGSTCPVAVDYPDPTSLNGGETIATAATISSLPAAVTGSLYNYDQDYDFSSYVWYYEGETGDAVYSYTATSDDSINVCFEAIDDEESIYFPFIAIIDADASVLACERLDTTDPNIQVRLLNFPVTAGETYYIVVSYSYGNVAQGSTYTLRIAAPDYKFISYLHQNAVGRTTFDAIAGHQYLFELGADPLQNGYICDGYLTIIPNPVIPENDDCVNATDGGILEPESVIQLTGDNRGAPSVDCSITFETPEVWVKFETEEAMSIAVNLCGAENEFHSFYTVMMPDCPCDPENGVRGPEIIPINEPCLSQYLYFEDVPAGTYYYPIASKYYSEGEYTINIRGIVPQVCGDNAIFGMVPLNDISAYCWFIQSDICSSYTCADKFYGLDDPITGITWWGDLESDSSFCDLDSAPFQIIFCNDNSGVPGDTVASFDVEASVHETGFLVNYGTFQRRFTTELPNSVSLTDGWVFIRGNNGEDCAFTWQTSSTSGGNGKVYDGSLNSWSSLGCDFAFCLNTDDINSVDNPEGLPLNIELLQNYPNPFNATTEIKYALAVDNDVTIEVYNVIGQKVVTLVDEKQTAGYHSLIWDGTNESGQVVSSGMYLYKMVINEDTFVKKMVMLK